MREAKDLPEANPELPKTSPYTDGIDISFHDKNKNAMVFVQRFHDRINLTWHVKKRYLLLGKDISADNVTVIRLFKKMGQID